MQRMWIFQRGRELRYGLGEEITNYKDARRNIKDLDDMIMRDVAPVVEKGARFSCNYLGGTRYRVVLDGATASVFTQILTVSGKGDVPAEAPGKISYKLNVKVIVGKIADRREEPKIVKEIRRVMGQEIKTEDIAEGTVLNEDDF